MRSIYYNLKNFETKKNFPNELSEVLRVQAGINETLQLDGESYTRIRLTAYEKLTGKNLITGNNEITITNKFTALERLEECIVIQVESNGKKLKVLSADPQTKKISFYSDENLSGVNLKVYYLPSDGNFQVIYEPTGGSSTVRKVFYRGSFTQIHQKDQYRDLGIVIPNRIIFPDWNLKIYVNTEAEINFNNELAFVEIPVISYDADEFANIVLSKGYTVEQMKNLQMLKDN